MEQGLWTLHLEAEVLETLRPVPPGQCGGQQELCDMEVSSRG